MGPKPKFLSVRFRTVGLQTPFEQNLLDEGMEEVIFGELDGRLYQIKNLPAAAIIKIFRSKVNKNSSAHDWCDFVAIKKKD